MNAIGRILDGISGGLIMTSVLLACWVGFHWLYVVAAIGAWIISGAFTGLCRVAACSAGSFLRN